MEVKPRGERFCLYGTADLEEVLERMAAEAAALLADAENPMLLGILRRGVPLAEMLQQRLATRFGLDIPRHGLKLKRYGDDLALLHPDTQLTESAEFAALDVSRATILVVDDVLYQGHSLARVLGYLSHRRVPVIRAAVLADRCCPLLPITAEIVGVRLQVAPGDVVECNVPPYEKEFKIEVLRPRR
ncbi:MAG: phosphoribosyltransferase [Rhodocyclales bacterium]|nr:phosphoribosyltransferase [Rhodocyclales bacterium]